MWTIQPYSSLLLSMCLLVHCSSSNEPTAGPSDGQSPQDTHVTDSPVDVFVVKDSSPEVSDVSVFTDSLPLNDGAPPGDGTLVDVASDGTATDSSLVVDGSSDGVADGPKPYPYTLSPTNGSFKVAWKTGNLNCTMTATQMASSSAASVSFASSTIYLGWSQVSANNQDPVIARVDGSTIRWCLAAESQAPDGRSFGLAWNGLDTLYAVYTVVGGGTNFDGKGGWIPAYGTIGSGGNKTVTVIAKHDANNGLVQKATFIPAQLSNGKINSLFPRAFTVRDDFQVEFLGDSAFSSLNPDKSRQCEGGTDYPFGYIARFSPDLMTMSCSSTESCSKVAAPCQ